CKDLACSASKHRRQPLYKPVAYLSVYCFVRNSLPSPKQLRVQTNRGADSWQAESFSCLSGSRRNLQTTPVQVTEVTNLANPDTLSREIGKVANGSCERCAASKDDKSHRASSWEACAYRVVGSGVLHYQGNGSRTNASKYKGWLTNPGADHLKR